MGRAALKNVKHVKSVAYFFGLRALRHMLRALRTRLKIYDYSRGQQQADRQTDSRQKGQTDRRRDGHADKEIDRKMERQSEMREMQRKVM